MDNTLNARLQHAVIGQGTSVNSVPKIGEMVFNSELTNFKVGDGVNTYNHLNNFLPSIPSEQTTQVFTDIDLTDFNTYMSDSLPRQMDFTNSNKYVFYATTINGIHPTFNDNIIDYYYIDMNSMSELVFYIKRHLNKTFTFVFSFMQDSNTYGEQKLTLDIGQGTVVLCNNQFSKESVSVSGYAGDYYINTMPRSIDMNGNCRFITSFELTAVSPNTLILS